MWVAEEELGEPQDIRQGDLLKDLFLPRLSLPFDVTHVPGSELTAGTRVSIPAAPRDFLVVSQCCTIENGAYVAVAPVQSTGPLDGRQLARYLAEEPPPEGDLGGNEEAGYVYDHFRLEPIEGVLEEDGPRQLKVVDFGRTLGLEGQVSDLWEHRAARMTAQGRRLLRINLTLYWARPEQGDVERLAQDGLPPGPSE